MKAVILAAGKSTRTYPLTITKPKPLLKVANKTILEHNLEQLQELIDEVIIVVGYKRDMIVNYLGNKYGKLKIKYVVQEEQNGNGKALQLAQKHLENKFLVMNSDDLFSKKDIKKCLAHEYSILVKYVDDLSRFGEVIYDKKGVKELREKPGHKEGLANTGLMVLSKDVFRYELKKSERNEFEITDYIKHLVEDNKKVYYERVEDFWIPITYPWNLLEANEFLLKGIVSDKKGKIEKGAILKGPVVVGKNSLIKSGAYIEGQVVIGDNCEIGPNCYIRAYTSIGSNSKIGNAVEVKNSIIGNNTNIGHLSYVGDSVIGDNVNFGAGTIVANLRHDDANVKSVVKEELTDSGRRKLGTIIGDDVHTGINTSIYPGRKIWPNKSTLPGEIVKRDIE